MPQISDYNMKVLINSVYGKLMQSFNKSVLKARGLETISDIKTLSDGLAWCYYCVEDYDAVKNQLLSVGVPEIEVKYYLNWASNEMPDY